MAHQEQKDFFQKLKYKFPYYFNQKKVLEIGSLDINGTIREFFTECDYIGLDVSFGKGVDIVCEGQNYNAPDNTYDIVCSAECFEHNPYWLETFMNMIRLCKDGGIVVFTCATDGRPEHGTTRTTPADSPLTIEKGWDYYKNLNQNDFISQINFDLFFDSYEFEVEENHHDLFFYGIIGKSKFKLSSEEKKSIPVIGVPIVNGIQWLQRLIDSIDYPVDDLFIVNNNGRGQLTEELNNIAKIKHGYIKNIKVCHLPSNIGCSGAWNLIIKCYMMSPYWIISNHDIAFTPGLLEEIVAKSMSSDCGMIKPKEFQWDLFLIKDSVIQKCGLFDENFYPAYVEDCDYHVRLLNKNIQTEQTNLQPLHGDQGYEKSGSQTWRTEPEIKSLIDQGHDQNCWYMSEKWGSNWRDENWNFNPWQSPFNKSDIPTSYTRYDLNFIRGKYLGF